MNCVEVNKENFPHTYHHLLGHCIAHHGGEVETDRIFLIPDETPLEIYEERLKKVGFIESLLSTLLNDEDYIHDWYEKYDLTFLKVLVENIYKE